MARGVQISPEIRAQVIAELMTGAKPAVLAKKYHLGEATVHRLRKGISPAKLEEVEREKQDSINQILLETVSVHCGALNRIAEYVSQAEYLKAKSPESIGELYEKLAVTPLSILEAASAAGEDETETDTTG